MAAHAEKAKSDLEESLNEDSQPYVSFTEKPSFSQPVAVEDKEREKWFLQVIYLSLGAMAGALVRIMLAQLFGEECANPGTVGWLSAGSPLCVTKDGEATQQGGIIFADLPSNMLGSFLMGLFQDGAVLGLAVPLAIAWVTPHHPFQDMGVLHTAFKTGFCGSLTTFSSWNSEMVVLMYGTGTTRSSRVWQAFFGYIVGMETALGSFVCGKSVALKLHGIINPELAAEAHAMIERKDQGVFLNRDLPDFERRFLPCLNLGSMMDYPLGQTDALERWRSSTTEARRVGSSHLAALAEVETTILLHSRPISPELESIVRAQGWDIDSLKHWAYAKSKIVPYIGSSVNAARKSVWFTLHFAVSILCTVTAFLILSLMLLDGNHAHTVTYRTMAYATLFAPTGALLRWWLSAWNGKLPRDGWQWFPFGTYMANMIGSAVSIVGIAMEYHLESVYDIDTFWIVGSIRAVKVGFAGSLTTVSTFVAEVSGFMKAKKGYAYPYILMSLGSACAIAVLIYPSIVYWI